MCVRVPAQVIIDLERFGFASDVDFVNTLLIEKSVFVMPGKVKPDYLPYSGYISRV